MGNSLQRNITVLEICNSKLKELLFLPPAPTPSFRQNFLPALAFLQMVCISYLCSYGSTSRQHLTYCPFWVMRCQVTSFALGSLIADSNPVFV